MGILRTLLFFLLVYFLIKFISRKFLSPSSSKKRKSGARMFYDTFRQFQQSQQQQKRQNQNKNQGADRFEEIEEAEFEDVTEEDNSTSKSSD